MAGFWTVHSSIGSLGIGQVRRAVSAAWVLWGWAMRGDHSLPPDATSVLLRSQEAVNPEK